MTLDLGKQKRGIEPIRFPNGEEYACFGINAIGLGLLKGIDLQNPQPEDAIKFYQVAKTLVPDAPEEEIDALELDLVTAIILHSQGRLEEVQAELGKEAGSPVGVSS